MGALDPIVSLRALRALRKVRKSALFNITKSSASPIILRLPKSTKNRQMKAKSGFDDAHINADPRYFFENK